MATYEKSEYGRVFNSARQEQGFISQADLDAFYRHYDHQKNCSECQQHGPGVWLDDGFQPTMNSCAVADRLYCESLEVRKTSVPKAAA